MIERAQCKNNNLYYILGSIVIRNAKNSIIQYLNHRDLIMRGFLAILFFLGVAVPSLVQGKGLLRDCSS